MNLGPLRVLRARRLADALGTAALLGVAAGLAAVLAAVCADAAAGLPAWARAGALALGGACAVGGVVACARRLARGDWTLAATARFAAARADGAVNALASYLELGRAGALPGYVAARLEAAAAREAAALRPAALVDLGRVRRVAALSAALSAALAVPTLLGYDLAGRFGRLAGAPGAGAAGVAAATPLDPGDRIAVTIVPPEYTGRGPVRLDDPSEVTAPAGARVAVELVPGVPGVAAGLSVNGADPEPMRADPSGALAGSFTARDEGSVAVRPAAGSVERPAFLLPLRVVADRAPEVRIVSPKTDLLVDPAVRPRTLAVEFEASDDYGLGAIRLKYIRSTGEGDAAEFVGGELPVAIVERRTTGRVLGRCVVDLDKAGVVAGAALVYHVEAQDRNTVTGPSTGMSESLVFEVADPKPPASITIGELKPEELQRYLMSQRMILEHTLKLEAARPKLAREELLARSTEIAGEQREFKEGFSQFIEIHGADDHDHDAAGPLSDAKSFEEAQRHASEEAREEATDPNAKGREAHEKAVEAKTEAHQHGAAGGETTASTPVRELQLAVAAMWDAEGALGIAEVAAAIPHEKRVIDHLKRAQRAVRYFPRVKVKTKPIDLKRRYAGDLADIKNRVERLAKRDLAPEERALRDGLAALYREMQAASSLDPDRGGADAAARASAVGARVSSLGAGLLALETGYQPALVAVSARLSAAAADARRLAGALGDGDAGRARSAVTALDDALAWSAGQLASLLDARASTRGGAGAPAPAGDRRAAGYFRRLAGGGE